MYISPVVGAGVVVIAGGDVRHELLDALLDLPEARLLLLEALLEEAPEVGRVRRRRGQGRHRGGGAGDLKTRENSLTQNPGSVSRGKRLSHFAYGLFYTSHFGFFSLHALQSPNARVGRWLKAAENRAENMDSRKRGKIVICVFII